MNYMQIIPVKCDCCGEMTQHFSSKNGWFGKYLKPEENRICRKCIRIRDGYAEEFLEKIGVSVEILE